MDALMNWLRPSTMMIKRKGDKGSICRMTREGEKGWDGTPLIKIDMKAKEVTFKIQST